MKDLKITRTNTLDPKIKGLIKLLDKELRGYYGDIQDNYDVHNDTSKGFSAILIEENEEPIGCGAFKPYDETSAELKRIFLRNEARGKGLSKLIVKALEDWILEENLPIARLETGKKHPAKACNQKHKGQSANRKTGKKQTEGLEVRNGRS